MDKKVRSLNKLLLRFAILTAMIVFLIFALYPVYNYFWGPPEIPLYGRHFPNKDALPASARKIIQLIPLRSVDISFFSSKSDILCEFTVNESTFISWMSDIGHQNELRKISSPKTVLRWHAHMHADLLVQEADDDSHAIVENGFFYDSRSSGISGGTTIVFDSVKCRVYYDHSFQ